MTDGFIKISELGKTNNAMWIVNPVTGERVLVAKYTKETGWFVFYGDLVERLDALFKNHTDCGEAGTANLIIEYQSK